MFDKIKAALNSFKRNEKGDLEPTNVSGYSALDMLALCRTPSYDNTFPNIARIAEAFAEVAPYAIDERGKRLTKQPPLIEALYNPNREMSGPDFWEALIVMMLVHPMVYLLVWRRDSNDVLPGGPLTPDNIAGFTFLENVSVSRANGKTTYFAGTNTYTDKDVLALSLNVNPYNLLDGYSPSQAVKKWATVDDYIAEFQAGYFRNHAVPAGQFIITAPTVAEYNEIVDNLQAHHRGARNANNVAYVHRPTSAINGKPMPAAVEWVPFADANKDMSLQDLFNQANKKIDMNFGVPEEVKGYLQNSNYASAEVADYVFARRVVYPKLVKVYSKMTHGLNNMTGGLGFALSFDFEPPVLTDTRKVQADSFRTLIDAGFGVEETVEALQLPRSFLRLANSQRPTDQNVQAADDGAERPSQAWEATKSAKVKAIDLPTDQTLDKPINPELIRLMGSYLGGIVEHAIEEIGGASYENDEARDVTIAQLRAWLDESGYAERTIKMIMAVLTYLLLSSGQTSADEFATQLGLSELTLILDDAELEQYANRISELLYKFGYDTIDEIRVILDKAILEKWNGAQIRAAIENLQTSDQYRVSRWAASEGHFAEVTGIMMAARQAETVTGMRAVKTWRINPASPDTCEDCVGMDGQTVPLDEPFSNGNMVPHYHPHCYCFMEVRFIQPTKSIKVCCPKCGRYIMESTGGVMKNVICANSKCKSHWDFEIMDGKVKSTLREK